jgi:hypothetical protein
MKNGGIIGPKNISTKISNTGIYGLLEQQSLIKNNTWPKPVFGSQNLFNLVGNPIDMFAWNNNAPKNNCTLTRDTAVTDSPYGGVPMRMNVSGADPHVGTYTTNAGGPWNITSAANGQTWTVGVLAKANVSTQIQLFIFGSAAGGTASLAAGTIASNTHSVGTSWGEYFLQYTFSNAVVEAIQIRLDGPDAGGSQQIWFDGLQVYRVS